MIKNKRGSMLSLLIVLIISIISIMRLEYRISTTKFIVLLLTAIFIFIIIIWVI
jgi:hypothetical protein